MCGSSGSGSTAPPPSPPPTTFNYQADTSNDQTSKQRAGASSTELPKTFGSELGSAIPSASSSPTNNMMGG
jgi:hypothetical protein